MVVRMVTKMNYKCAAAQKIPTQSLCQREVYKSFRYRDHPLTVRSKPLQYYIFKLEIHR